MSPKSAQDNLTEAVQHLPSTYKNEINANQQLLDGASFMHLIQGQTLFQQGDPATYAFIVVTGSVKITVHTADSETLLTIISEGEVGGALLMGMENSQYPGSIVAMCRSSVILVPRNTYINHWTRNASLYGVISKCVYGRIQRLQQEKLLQKKDVEKRIVHFLVNHFLTKRDLVGKKITRKQIAQSIGATTETVIRILKRLEKAELISTTNSIISIKNESGLKQRL